MRGLFHHGNFGQQAICWSLLVCGLCMAGSSAYLFADDQVAEFSAVREQVLARIQKVRQFHCMVDVVANDDSGLCYAVDWNGDNWRVDHGVAAWPTSDNGAQQSPERLWHRQVILTNERRIEHHPLRLNGSDRIIATSKPIEQLPIANRDLAKWYLLGALPWGDAFLVKYGVDNILWVGSENAKYEVAMATVDDIQVYRLLAQRTDRDLSLTAVVSLDYRILSVELSSGVGVNRVSAEDWRPCKQDFEWPSIVTHDRMVDGEVVNSKQFRLSDVEINVEIDPRKFLLESLSFVESDVLSVSERDESVRMYVMRNGVFVDRETRPGMEPLRPPVLVTQEPRSNWKKWMFIIGLNGLVVGGLLIALRKREHANREKH